jgi:carbonic anhydrase
MAKALFDKISKGSGDIVIRTGDLPAGAASAEMKPADVKPKAGKAAAKQPEKDNHGVHWSYVDGPGGPENWGDLSKENLVCSKGKTQSPININIDNAVKVDLPALEFAYRQSPLSIVDNGHTIMVNYGEGSNLMVDGRQYRLVQFHFHKPSEEAINGERMDMVVHLVHQRHDGALAVVAVLMTTKKPVSARKYWWGDDSKPQDNPLIQTLWNNIPLVKERVESPGVWINVNQLLPEDKTYFTYMGSLTEPPCSENVLWFVMKNPILVSEDQVMNFGRIYPSNARPLQPKGDRLVKEAKLLQ